MNNFKGKLGKSSDYSLTKPKIEAGLDLFAEKQVAFDVQSYSSNYYRFWIDEAVEGTSYYRPLLQTLFSAGENDTVELIIDTGGGYLSGALSIIQAIQNTEATVVGVLLGDASSAGSLILLACPNVVLTEYATMMIHQGSHGCWGKVGEVQSRIDFSRMQMNRIFDDIYGGFCTEEELIAIKAGADLYLDSAEIAERLQLKLAYMEEKAQEELEQAELEMQEAQEALQRELDAEESAKKPVKRTRKPRAAAKRTRKTPEA